MLAKGSFCRFFCDGSGWDGMGREWVRRAIRRGTHGGGGERGEFWERVHVLNRLVRGYAEKTKERAFFPCYFACWLIPDSLTQIRIAFAGPLFFLSLALAAGFLSVRLSTPRPTRLSLRNVLSFMLRFFFILTRRLRFPFKSFMREIIRIEMHSRDLLVNDRLAGKRTARTESVRDEG